MTLILFLRAKDDTIPKMEAENITVRDGAKTPTQLCGGHKSRREVTSSKEGRRPEAEKAAGEADRAGGRGAGEDATKRRRKPCASGEGAIVSERVGADTSEGRGADVGKQLTGSSGAGVHGTGRGEGADEPGRGSQNAIIQ